MEDDDGLISSVIQKLYIQHLELCRHGGDVDLISGTIDELSMIRNFLRGKTVVDQLKYSICKVTEMASYLDDIINTGRAVSTNEAYSIQRWLRQTKWRMIKSSRGDGEERKALISSVVQNLYHHNIYDKESSAEVEGAIDELKLILDFLRDKGSSEEVDCLICEAVEVALYLDQIVGTDSLEKEAASIRSRLRGIKLRMLGSGVDGEDPETLIVLLVQQLELKPQQYVEEIKRVVNELRMILDLLREEKTNLNKYLICDLIEIALYIGNIKENMEGDGGLGKEAESIQSWLREIRLRLRMLKSEKESTRSEDVGEGDEEDGVVGLHEQVRLVLGRAIFNEAKGHETALITGMVGIGKTSLARQVYNHPTVVDRFQRRAWVRVSGELTHKEILMKLIQQVVVSDSSLLILEEMDNRSLQHLLHQHLQGLPYLIVLDDLPKHMHLKSLLNAFPHDEDKVSRLLVTSRTKEIQTIVCYNHAAKPLDSDKSWKLFLNTIFRGDEFSSEEKFPKHLEEKGKEMLRKCGGLPLAIKEVALQLAEQRRRGSDWEQLLDSIDWGSTLALLENFYQEMDEELKSCFLHLALFKENTTMRAEKLLHVLITVGVLASNNELVTFLTKLERESIIDFKYLSWGSTLKSFDINAVLHMLSMRKAEEEIGFEILSKNNPPSQCIPLLRVINCSREMFDYSTNQDEHLVSLFYRGGGGYLDNTPLYWKSFELKLKVLDFEDFGLNILPESIGTLIELRYLGLRNNYLKKLPHSLVCLKKLEVLDVAQNFVVEVPDIIWDMSSLRNVFMSYAIFQKPLKIEALKKLVTMTYISIDDLIHERLCTDEEDGRTSVEVLSIEEEDGLLTIASLEELGVEEEDGLHKLTSLDRLGIEELDANSDVRKLFASLAEFDALERLVLRGFRFRSMPCLDKLRVLHSVTTLKLEGLLAKLPSVDNFPPNIRHLRLVNTCLDEDPMPVLEQLPHLTHLKLRNAYTGQGMLISDEWPGDLIVLCIEELWNLRNLDVEECAMMSLERLEIKNCPLLETLPEEIGSIGLLDLNMTTTKNIATKIRKSGFISKMRVVQIDP